MNNIDKNVKEILKEVVRFESIFEAMTILTKCSEIRFNEFLTYHNIGKDNLCCLVLDVAKNELVESGEMIHNKEDWFGSPYLKTFKRI